MRRALCCALAVDESDDSREAEEVLRKLPISFHVNKVANDDPVYIPPFLITPQGMWIGLDCIKRFADDSKAIEEIRKREYKNLPAESEDMFF